MSQQFSFPYQAYPEQQQLMQQIFSCIEESGVGCFESPTGTGKTLSTICSTFTWLEEAEKTQMEINLQPAQTSLAATAAANVDGGRDWLQSFVQQYEQSKAATTNTPSVGDGDVKLYDRLLERIKSASVKPTNQSKHSQQQRRQQESSFMNTLSKPTLSKSKAGVEDLPEYVSDAESLHDSSDDDNDDKDEDHNTTTNSHQRGSKSKQREKWNTLQLPQIFFCSRTHSQLTQFIHEIRKTRFQHIRCVVLGSRRNLCVNPAVQALKSDANMNERCLEMMTEQQRSKQQSKASTNKINKSNADTLANKRQKLKQITTTTAMQEESEACSFKLQQRERALALRLLHTPKDIEETLLLGDETHTCPYYASREAIAYAQVVCMPYNLLLQAEARQSLGINLQNRIVIFDEAHNLPEAIYNMYTAELTFDTLNTAASGLLSYLTHMQSRLGGKNLYYLNLLYLCTKKITALFADSPRRPALKENMVLTINEFLVRAGIDHVNLFKLTRFINTCNIVNRIGGYAATHATSAVSNQRHEVKYSLRAFTALINCLTRNNADGRVFLRPLPAVAVGLSETERNATVVIRYHLLDAATVFQEVTNTARSVILLGGTMQPFSFFTSSLLRHVPTERLKVFSCGHIVHPSHVLATVLSASLLEFTHDKRLALTTTDTLFIAIKMLCETVPYGLVIFFTSYQYMAAVAARWRSDGRLDQLQRLKPLFIETKTVSSAAGEQQTSIWEGYCAEIKQGRGQGAALWSVIGGRLSEGINFSDELARCVAVVGLPYPDTRDAVLQEKVRHYNEGTAAAGAVGGVSLPEMFCMRAVNQAIGRAIRHVNDFAAITLIDQRYTQPRIAQQLPGWIRQSLSQPSSMAALQQQLTAFYTSRNSIATSYT